MSETDPDTAPDQPSSCVNEQPGATRPASIDGQDKRAWLIVLAAIVGSLALLAWGRGHASAPGAHFPLSITVIPADAVNLDCSTDAHFGEVRCNFDAQGRSRSVSLPLRPYVTTGRELWLLSGVFEQPAVHDWLTQARRTGSSARVTIDCQATLLGQLRSVPVRWQSGAAFASESDVPVASVSDCRVIR